METAGEKAASVLERLRKEKPLVHHITNIVVANITANATLAAGALPVMAFAVDEVADLASTSNALVLNMGTPAPATVEAMIVAGMAANSRGIPVIFDPVGVGATPYRNRTAERILGHVKVSAVRGNASEVAFLSGVSTKIRGVEAIEQGVPPAELSPLASRHLGTVVAVTGPRDYISDGRRLAVVENGHAMMAGITGSGCVSTAVVAAFCAVEPDTVVASASALAYLGVAGQLAAEASRGPGSFQMNWLDNLANLSPRELAGLASISWTELA
ncbi:MAG: hydroxyethylthiazole kinase [Bacillota bacterium]